MNYKNSNNGGMMDNSLKLETITNGLLTLQKIKDLYNNGHRSDEANDGSYVKPDKLVMMRDVLSSVSEFLPQTRSGIFSSAFDQGTRFSSAYRELKHHVGGISRGAPAQADVFRTLKLLLPVLDFRHKIYMDKLVKIIEILIS